MGGLMEENDKSHTRDNVRTLTDREFQVLEHVITGKNNNQIAKELSISVHTIKAHVCSILNKMSVDDRVQAAVKAIRQGLVK